ncbi:MAG: CapA family protein [Lachnospiraceae bacterium]|nr:CapA family protein [Candidatus Colinaster scatohippi]
MANKKRRRSGKAALIFIEVLALILITGFGAMFLYAGVNGELKAVGDNKEAEDYSTQEQTLVEAVVEKIEPTPEPVRETVEESTEEETDNSRYGSLLADEEYCTQNHIYGKEAGKTDEISLLFAGDVGLSEGYANLGQLLDRGGDITTAFDENTLDVMRGADVFMINNEFPYTDRGTPTAEKTYTFRCSPKHVHYIADMGADIVSIANNHTYDYGEVSMLDTLDTLEEAGMPYVGAGRNIEEAIKPTYFIINDTRIAFVAATQIERVSNPDTKGATETNPGTFRCFYDDRICDVIREAAACSDYVVAYIHWGTELEISPDWAQLELAPKLQEAGANLIIGDHPHILQKLDYIGDTPVIYSLGNYWFNSKTLDTGLLEVILNPNASEDGETIVKSVRFIPAIQSGCKCNIVADGEKSRIINYMQSISSEVLIDENGYVYKK